MKILPWKKDDETFFGYRDAPGHEKKKNNSPNKRAFKKSSVLQCPDLQYYDKYINKSILTSCPETQMRSYPAQSTGVLESD